jgi:hypothetical protein
MRRSSGVALAYSTNIEVAVVVEHGGFEKFVFGVTPPALTIRRHQVVVRVRHLGILVEILHEGVCGRRLRCISNFEAVWPLST